MDVVYDVIRFLQIGGPFMVPIGLVLAIGCAIAIERFFFLQRATVVNRRDFATLMPLVSAGKFKDVVSEAETMQSEVSQLFVEAIDRMKTTRRRQDVSNAMEERLLETLPRIEKRTPYLATFANIATLLGLLGTIIGLIAAFSAVANADPSEKAALLSESISIAMNTTAFGLMVAIPDRKSVV